MDVRQRRVLCLVLACLSYFFFPSFLLPSVSSQGTHPSLRHRRAAVLDNGPDPVPANSTLGVSDRHPLCHRTISSLFDNTADSIRLNSLAQSLPYRVWPRLEEPPSSSLPTSPSSTFPSLCSQYGRQRIWRTYGRNMTAKSRMVLHSPGSDI